MRLHKSLTKRGARMPRKAIAATTVALLGVVALASVALNKPAVKSVQVESVAKREIRPSVFAAGQVVHGNEVRLSSEVIGKVKALHVVEGQAVERGELMLAIEDDAYAAEVARRRAAVRLQAIDMERKQLAIDTAQRQHDRNQRLFERSLLDEHAFEATAHRLRVAQIDLDSARELLEQARAALAQASEQLDKTQVRAPLPGVVTSLDIEAGETAIASTTNVPGSSLMVIADPNSLLVEIYVDEADVSDVHIGQAAEVVTAAHSDTPMAGTVEFIANTAKFRPNRRGLSFRARIRLSANTRPVRTFAAGHVVPCGDIPHRRRRSGGCAHPCHRQPRRPRRPHGTPLRLRLFAGSCRRRYRRRAQGGHRSRAFGRRLSGGAVGSRKRRPNRGRVRPDVACSRRRRSRAGSARNAPCSVVKA